MFELLGIGFAFFLIVGAPILVLLCLLEIVVSKELEKKGHKGFRPVDKFLTESVTSPCSEDMLGWTWFVSMLASVVTMIGAVAEDVSFFEAAMEVASMVWWAALIPGTYFVIIASKSLIADFIIFKRGKEKKEDK